MGRAGNPGKSTAILFSLWLSHDLNDEAREAPCVSFIEELFYRDSEV